MASADLRSELLCSICLSTFTDPVILRCGHNFCRGCIDQNLNTQDRSGVYSCPECRAKFQKRPELIKNINLRNVSERFLSTHPHQEEISGICCTYCVDSPVPAVKSCLLCEASLCDKHLRVHSKSPEHVMTDPSTSLENRKCSVHKKVLEYYCTEDAACICVSCSLGGEQRGHWMEMLDEASEKKKKKQRNVLQKLITKRGKTEEKVQSLEERRRKAQEKPSGEAERVTALFIDIRRRLDDDVTVRTGGAGEKGMAAGDGGIYGQGPADILLNVNTAANNLLISDDLKTATRTNIKQNRPETSERFQCRQVMSSRGFTSVRHYWDVEISGAEYWRVGMCYPSIDRRRAQSYIGDNNKSWCLCKERWCENNHYSVRHDNEYIQLPHQISSNRVRICLDYEAGQLFFYELCDPIRHLHTFTATFTEPLHAVLWIGGGYIKMLGGAASVRTHQHSENLPRDW